MNRCILTNDEITRSTSLFDAYDANNNKGIDLEEFLASISSQLKKELSDEEKKDYTNIFKTFDKNNDDKIDLEEFLNTTGEVKLIGLFNKIMNAENKYNTFKTTMIQAMCTQEPKK